MNWVCSGVDHLATLQPRRTDGAADGTSRSRTLRPHHQNDPCRHPLPVPLSSPTFLLLNYLNRTASSVQMVTVSSVILSSNKSSEQGGAAGHPDANDGGEENAGDVGVVVLRGAQEDRGERTRRALGVQPQPPLRTDALHVVHLSGPSRHRAGEGLFRKLFYYLH